MIKGDIVLGFVTQYRLSWDFWYHITDLKELIGKFIFNFSVAYIFAIYSSFENLLFFRFILILPNIKCWKYLRNSQAHLSLSNFTIRLSFDSTYTYTETILILWILMARHQSLLWDCDSQGITDRTRWSGTCLKSISALLSTTFQPGHAKISILLALKVL